jgi:hypothetical protein
MSVIQGVVARGEAMAGSRTLRHFHAITAQKKSEKQSSLVSPANDEQAFFTRFAHTVKTGEEKKSLLHSFFSKGRSSSERN